MLFEFMNGGQSYDTATVLANSVTNSGWIAFFSIVSVPNEDEVRVRVLALDERIL